MQAWKSEIGSSRWGGKALSLGVPCQASWCRCQTYPTWAPRGHPISTIPVARITAHATVPGFFFGFFCGTLVLVSWQASCSSLAIKLDFYKPTVLKVHPPFSRITADATVPHWLEITSMFLLFHDLIQMNGAWKIVSTVGVLTQALSVLNLLP